MAACFGMFVWKCILFSWSYWNHGCNISLKLNMKAKVTITFDVETEDYHLTPPTEKGVKELVQSMLDREADLPSKVFIEVSEI